MKNQDEKVNVVPSAMHKSSIRWEGLLTYVNNNRNESSNVISDDYDDMIYTLLLIPGRVTTGTSW